MRAGALPNVSMELVRKGARLLFSEIADAISLGMESVQSGIVVVAAVIVRLVMVVMWWWWGGVVGCPRPTGARDPGFLITNDSDLPEQISDK